MYESSADVWTPVLPFMPYLVGTVIFIWVLFFVLSWYYKKNRGVE